MELLDRAPTGSAPEAALHPPGGTTNGGGRPSLQERLESSRFGRRVLSVFLVALLAAVGLWNMPESAVRERAVPVVEPFVNTAGLDQRWNLFAPDPPKRTLEVVARIEYTDGSLALWRSPRNDRWRKWLSTITSGRSQRLWEPTAAWIAAHHDDGGRQTRRVELILRRRDLPEPGSQILMAENLWQESLFFTYDVPTGVER